MVATIFCWLACVCACECVLYVLCVPVCVLPACARAHFVFYFFFYSFLFFVFVFLILFFILLRVARATHARAHARTHARTHTVGAPAHRRIIGRDPLLLACEFARLPPEHLGCESKVNGEPGGQASGLSLGGWGKVRNERTTQTLTQNKPLPEPPPPPLIGEEASPSPQSLAPKPRHSPSH